MTGRSTGKPQTHSACYWIVGLHNKAQRPFVAIDLHAPDGDKIGETSVVTKDVTHRDVRTIAQRIAEQHALRHGIPAARVFFDPDSTTTTEHD